MLVSLLRSIAREETLSPTAFSLAVHNAAAGLLGQIRGDRTGHTALAAGRDTLFAGLIEAYARLTTDAERPVAVVFGDLPLPKIYERFRDRECGASAMACLMRRRASKAVQAPSLHPLPLAADAERFEGADVLARKLVAVLESGSSFDFGGMYGPAWRLAAG